MATKAPDEKYLGAELHVPLSSDGQVTAYVWPVRILTVREHNIGGPTIGVQVCNEEVLRWDCHGEPGHWHGGGYDRMGTPGNSNRSFPAGVVGIPGQIAWALQQIDEKCKELLEEAEHSSAAQILDPSLVQAAQDAIRAHLDKEGDLRSKAIKDNLISP